MSSLYSSFLLSPLYDLTSYSYETDAYLVTFIPRYVIFFVVVGGILSSIIFPNLLYVRGEAADFCLPVSVCLSAFLFLWEVLFGFS